MNSKTKLYICNPCTIFKIIKSKFTLTAHCFHTANGTPIHKLPKSIPLILKLQNTRKNMYIYSNIH